MKLISLEFLPRGVNGWESPLLKFADRTTSLFARNGSGKTPLIQSIAFCLGFSTNFREDIRERCYAVELTFSVENRIFKVRRELTKEFHLTITANGTSRDFFSEGDFSTVLFHDLAMQEPILVGTNRQSTKPYVSIVLPIFYVKQDGGYLDAYKAPTTFVQDQFVEMVRFAFGLPPKRSYTAQKDLLEAKDRLEAMQRRIVQQQKILADISDRVDDSQTAREAMDARAQLLNLQLNDLRESVNSANAASDALCDLLAAKEEKLRADRRRFYDLRARVTGIDSIRAEIEGEIQTLSLNEQSKRTFEVFGDICSRPGCGLFLSSTESYAKNLMYLKDQIKDLESNANRAEFQLEELERRIEESEKERQLIISKMESLPHQTSTDQLIAAVQALTKELLDIEQQRAALLVLSEERRKYIEFENEREKIQDKIATLENHIRGEHGFNQLRAKIRVSLVRWMDIIKTLNVSHDIDIDPNFKFRFGTEQLEVITGSTRSRLVLAIHAAIFEAYLEKRDNPFRFLILDTPKQHELDGADLANYLKELQAVCDKYGGQIVISSTEYRHEITEQDVEWLPQYPGEKQPMYLGKHGTCFISSTPQPTPS